MTPSPKSDRALSFFQDLRGSFQRAAANAGRVEEDFLIGGHAVRLCFAGKALSASLTPALRHLTCARHIKPALTIHLWDSASTGSKIPERPWENPEFFVRGEIPGFNDERIHVAFLPGEDSLNALDSQSDEAYYWTRDAATVPYYTQSSPMRAILHWWMIRHGRQLIHGAAVGLPSAGALIVGRGGSGKSTTAISCLESELLYAGDDYALIGAQPEPFVYSLYNSAKLDAGQIEKFPSLLPLVSNRDKLKDEKALLFLHGALPGKISAGFPVKAVIVPRITSSAEPAVKPLAQAAALAALAPSTIFQLPGGETEAFRLMTSLVRKVRCYSLELCPDLRKNPQAIAALLKESA